MNEISLNVELELHASGETLSGAARAEGREPVEFQGWIGLIAALDAIVANAQDEAGEDAEAFTSTS